jgi:hypothetical protein
MAQCGQRKCLCCGEFFFPDHRSVGRQRYCSAPDCRRASKATSQASWLAKTENQDYFKGAVHVERVRAWRAAHPGYSRPRPAQWRALQDPLPAQVPDSVEQIANRGAPPETPGEAALQDLLNPSTALLAGLIAHLFEVTLQDEMAATTRRLVQRGHDLIGGGGGDEGIQTRAAARAAAPGARAVQLG